MINKENMIHCNLFFVFMQLVSIKINIKIIENFSSNIGYF